MDYKYSLGWLRKSEIKEAAKIEWYSAERFWTESDFNLIFSPKNCRYVVPLVCRIEDKPSSDIIAGFCVYKKTPNAYNILNLVVHPDYRRKGIGTLFIKNLLFNLRKGNRESISIRVRDKVSGLKFDGSEQQLVDIPEAYCASVNFLKNVKFKLQYIVPDFYSVRDKIGRVIGAENALEYCIEK